MPEKIINVKVTSKRKAHKRKIHFEGKKDITQLRDGINNVNFISKNNNEIKALLISNDWDIYNSRFFGMKNDFEGSIIHFDNNEIYAMSKIESSQNSVYISLLEVNPTKRRQGHGIKTMKDIVETIIDSDKYEKIKLTSADSDSDKFYDAIGMKRSNPENEYEAEYKGDKQWMKKFMKSI